MWPWKKRPQMNVAKRRRKRYLRREQINALKARIRQRLQSGYYFPVALPDSPGHWHCRIGLVTPKRKPFTRGHQYGKRKD